MVDDDTYVRPFSLVQRMLGSEAYPEAPWAGQSHRPLAIGREFTRRSGEKP